VKLSGLEIARRIEIGSIVIEPFDPAQMNPNSYDLRLDKKLIVYDEVVLDMKKQNRTHEVIIPPEGIELRPNIVYIGQTIEYTETHDSVPCIDGRSSVGRLGINIHSTAGFGDVGFCGTWTLEISVLQPIRIYAGVRFCQIHYEGILGEYETYQSDKYQGQREPRPSGLWKEFQDAEARKAPSPDAGGRPPLGRFP